MSAGSLFLLDCSIHARTPAGLSDKKYKTRRKDSSTEREQSKETPYLLNSAL